MLGNPMSHDPDDPALIPHNRYVSALDFAETTTTEKVRQGSRLALHSQRVEAVPWLWRADLQRRDHPGEVDPFCAADLFRHCDPNLTTGPIDLTWDR